LAKNNEELYILKKGSFNSRVKRILAYRYIHNLSQSLAKEQGHFDLVYIRYSIPFFSYVKTLRILKSICPKVVVEIPTYPHQNEYKNDRRVWRKPLYPIMEILNRRASIYVDLYSLIGKKVDTCYQRPAINISNGVTVKDIPIKKKAMTENEINIIAVASMAKWHGYDRLISGLYNYISNGGREKVFIHLVGPDGDGSLMEWKSLTNKLRLKDYVLFEGPMYGDDLARMIDKCDIACSALAPYVKGMEDGTSIKVAEYCARGIPFIWTRDENDTLYPIPHSYGGFLNDDSPIDIDRIVKIVKEIKKETGISEKMRKYAEENLSWNSQYKLILEYFEHWRF